MAAQLLRKAWLSRRTVAGAAVYWSGGARLYELFSRPTGAIVLMYHSVAPAEVCDFVDPPNRIAPELFERQMAFLRKHRRVIPLTQLVDAIGAGDIVPAGTVCITFDDGYRDNLTVAAPILRKFQLPATLFLATGYVERSESQWADVLHWLLRHRTIDQLAIPGEEKRVFNLAFPDECSAVRDTLHRRLLRADYGTRTELLQDLRRQLKPHGVPPRLTLNWDEVRDLQRNFPLFDIGGHTRDHIDLGTLDVDATRIEVEGCAADLRREMGMEPGHFSFPYGRWCKESRAAVASAGWRSAVGDGDNRRVGPASDRFCIPRVDAPRTMTELRFKTSGAYPDVFPKPRME